jgi:uncharacterized protein (TIGR03435 family)
MRLALVCVLSACVVGGQTFEAATVKPNRSGSGNSSSHNNPGTLMAVNNTLAQYVQRAFGLPEYRVAAPEWMKTERYDITAKTGERVSDPDMRKMMQALLVERFQMKYHWEKRTLPALALLVGKGGVKFKVGEGEGSSTNTNNGKMASHRITMVRLAEFLSGQLGMPVVDATGLTERYDLTLEWTREDRKGNTDGDGGPTIQTALGEQLGLRLESRKMPFEVLVVDRAERVPVEN